jgi:hypothetical protein
VLTINEVDLKVEGADVSPEVRSEIVTTIKNNMIRLKEDIQEAKPVVLKKLPMDLAMS